MWIQAGQRQDKYQAMQFAEIKRLLHQDAQTWLQEQGRSGRRQAHIPPVQM